MTDHNRDLPKKLLDEFVEFEPSNNRYNKPTIYIRDSDSIRLSKSAIDLGGFEFDDKCSCKCSVLINNVNIMFAIKMNPNGNFTLKKYGHNFSLNSRSLIDYLIKLGYLEKKHYIATILEKGVLLVERKDNRV